MIPTLDHHDVPTGPPPSIHPPTVPPPPPLVGADTTTLPPPPAAPTVPPRPRRASRALAVVSLVAAGAVAGGVTARLVTPDEITTRTVVRTTPAGADERADVSSLVSDALPSVVSIEVVNPSGEAAGSGFVVSADGDIVTNAHVVNEATSVKVTFHDGTEKTARIVGVDRTDDLAVVRVEATDLEALPLGKSGDLAVGQPVVAIGNALALTGGPTATEGIVSALDRSIDADNGEHLSHLIQTDAAINPGNSGGPLLDLSGSVIGINAAGSTAAQNIGFAISIDGARSIIEQLEQGKTVTRAYLGVSTEAVDGGLRITDVGGESGAEHAGLRPGDVIISADGHATTDQDSLRDAIAAAGAGKPLKLHVRRGSRELDVTATLSSHEA